jgi:hypothetical protein
MPRYDFQCANCEYIFEVTCKISEKQNPHACPECLSTHTESKIFSAPHLGDSVSLGYNPHQRGFKEVLNKIHKKSAGSILNKTTEL